MQLCKKLTDDLDILPVESELQDWFQLLKPKVISLVVFTGFVGIVCAPGPANIFKSFIAILCICLASGGAGAINMWYDRDIDKIMSRTSSRPIPLGKINPSDALIYGLAVSLISVILIYLVANALAAFLLAFSIFFYCVIYTILLKRSTPQNIVIGGAAGAFPPLIGWTAITGQISIFPIILCLIIFLWTPPHFWSLSLYACKDYERAGVPMLPVVKGEKYTRWNIFTYTIILGVVSLFPVYYGFTSYIYEYTAYILDLIFIYMSIQILLEKQNSKGVSLENNKAAKRTFYFSLLYLFLLFLSLMIDHFIK